MLEQPQDPLRPLEKESEKGKNAGADGSTLQHLPCSPGGRGALQARLRLRSLFALRVPRCQGRRFVALQLHIGFHLRQNGN